MTISAILPTYNRAHVLARALHSVFGQTRPPDEVIVVDDASTDDTAAVVARFPGVRLVRQERNQGAGHARNTGIRLAKGELIAFIDSDDVWLSNKLEAQLAHLQKAPDVDLLCTGITVRERSGTVSYHGFRDYAPANGWTFVELQTYPFSTPTWLIRRATLLELGLFDESLPNCEDLDLLARLVTSRRVEVLPEPLTVKYNQSDSINADRARTAESYAVLFERHEALWRKAPAAIAVTQQRLAHLHIRAGDLRGGRGALGAAIRSQPLRPSLWALWVLSWLGARFYLRGRRWL